MTVPAWPSAGHVVLLIVNLEVVHVASIEAAEVHVEGVEILGAQFLEILFFWEFLRVQLSKEFLLCF